MNKKIIMEALRDLIKNKQQEINVLQGEIENAKDDERRWLEELENGKWWNKNDIRRPVSYIVF